MNDEVKITTNTGGLGEQFDASAKPSLSVDVEKYQAYLDGSEMNDSEKEEFLQALWQIILGFVEFGFGVHPVQEVCGKPEPTGDESAAAADDEVCLGKLNKNNNDTHRSR